MVYKYSKSTAKSFEYQEINEGLPMARKIAPVYDRISWLWQGEWAAYPAKYFVKWELLMIANFAYYTSIAAKNHTWVSLLGFLFWALIDRRDVHTIPLH